MNPSDDERTVRVPLEEEQVSLEKRRSSAGEVRVKRRVVTEPRTLTARVTVETVTVDRVPASELPGPFGDERDAFREQTIVVPLRREEIELRKRVVTREEIRVAKHVWVEDRDLEVDVRREALAVERDSSTGKPETEDTRP